MGKVSEWYDDDDDDDDGGDAGTNRWRGRQACGLVISLGDISSWPLPSRRRTKAPFAVRDKRRWSGAQTREILYNLKFCTFTNYTWDSFWEHLDIPLSHKGHQYGTWLMLVFFSSSSSSIWSDRQNGNYILFWCDISICNGLMQSKVATGGGFHRRQTHTRGARKSPCRPAERTAPFSKCHSMELCGRWGN